MPSFSDRLEAAIGTTARPAPQPQPRKRRQYGHPWERAGMSKEAWLRWRDERQPHRLEEAMAFGTPEAVGLMRAIPGAIVREVRITPPEPETPAPEVPDAGDETAAVTVDEAGMSVTDGDVTTENDEADEILAVASGKVLPTTSCVSDDDETPPIIPTWPRRVKPR